MSHFYGTLHGSSSRATGQGTKNSGLLTIAASWNGCVKVDLYVDKQGRDCFKVCQEPWEGAGIREDIAGGFVGEPACRPLTNNKAPESDEIINYETLRIEKKNPTT